jgi:hypothetical protein
VAKRGRKAGEVRIPIVSDPVWAEWTAPLLDFLEEPRSWKALHQWRKAQRVSGDLFRNMLAWLEDAGVALSEGKGKAVRWMAVDMTEDEDEKA